MVMNQDNDISKEESGNSFKKNNSQCWRKFSTKQKLISVSLILLLALVGLLLLIFLVVFPKQDADFPGKRKICKTEGCIHAADNLIASINISVNPCDDFYAYSCDLWIHNKSLTSATITSQSDQLRINVKDTLKEILNDPVVIDSQIPMVSTYMKSCMDLERIEENGNERVLHFLKDVTSFLKESEISLQELLTKIAKMIQWTSKNYFIIPFGLQKDNKNVSKYIVKLDRPGFFVSQDILKDPNSSANKKIVILYRKLIIQVFDILNVKGIQVSEVEGIIDFEFKLYEFLLKNPLNERMTIERLNVRIDKVNWLHFIQSITNDSFEHPEDRFTLVDEVDVERLSYLQEVVEYLSTDQAIRRQAAVYIMWRVVFERMFFLPKKFQDIMVTFIQQMDSHPPPSREELCFNLVNQDLPEAIAYLYIWKKFPPREKNQSSDMVKDIKRRMRKDLKTADWMNNSTTREGALKKIDKMRSEVAYPDWLASQELILEVFKTVDFGPDIFDNSLNISRFSMLRLLRLLKKEDTYFPLLANPTSVNGVYSQGLNMLTVSAGMFMPPFYQIQTPWFLNFGAIGSVVAHEITHGFDTEGRQRGADGNFHNWWTDDDLKNFNQKSDCFVQQYNKYGENGSLTLQENIADNGGLRLAFNAFKDSTKNSEIESLPNFEDYSPEQMFFLAYGSIWCTTQTQDTTDAFKKHSFNRFRSLGPVSNMVEFAQAFNCSEGSPMNPKNKCILW